MNNALFTSKTGLWETPQEFFDKLNREFDFTLDACATPENAVEWARLVQSAVWQKQCSIPFHGMCF